MLNRILLIVVLFFSSSAAFACETPATLTAQQPNVVWIMSEDNSKHYLKLFDKAGAETPNIRKMATNGVMFERAFSNAPVCSVARTTLITGVFAPRLGTQFHRCIQPVTMPSEWKMFPAYLRAAGYYTTNAEKKDYNAIESADVWDESSRNAHWKNRAENQPFFHVQTFKDSHESSLHFGQNWVDNPDNETDPASITLHPYHPDTPLFRLTYARYHDRIKTIDEKVGGVIKELADAGELENTFVFYFGDHGGVLARGKGFANESGLHVPLVVRVPEKYKSLSPFQKNSKTNGFVEFVDFGPTVMKLAGVEVPSHMDGRPFMGQGVSSDDVNIRNETFGHADRMDEKYDMVRTLRVGKWKYIRNYQAIYPDGLQNNYRYINLAWQEWRKLNSEGKLNDAQSAFFKRRPPEQLFDVLADPHEVNDLAADPANQETLVELRTKLTTRVKAMPDLSFFPENYLVDDAVNSPIQFGQDNKARIASLVDVADLALVPFEEALPKMMSACDNQDPIQRYWAYSVASIHGKKQDQLIQRAKSATSDDTDMTVRLRAAEYLGTVNIENPTAVIQSILAESDSPTLNLIALQTLVHFQDGDWDFDTKIDTTNIKTIDQQTLRRIGYLDGWSQNMIKQKQKEMTKSKNGKNKKNKSK